MANKIEYSRLVFKRSTLTGVEPTIPTGTTIDNTWLDTDLLIGEGFINVEDDKFWYRTNNGLVEVSLSGISSNNYYTELCYLSGNTLIFDRNDLLDAYSVDLSALTGLTGSGNYLPLSGGSLTGGLSGTSLNLSSIGSGTPTINLGLDSSGNVVTGTTGGSSTFTGGTVGEFSATSVSILNSGATARNYFDYSNNTIQSGVTNSAIVAGSGNTIPTGLRNVFVSGVNLTASTNDTAYFSNVNAAAFLSGGTNLYSIFSTSTPTAGNYIGITGSTVISLTGVPMDISFAISDETTAITTGTSKITFYAPYALTLTSVIATVSQSGSTTSEFDINVNGASIMTRRPTIDANEFHSDDASAGLPTIASPSVAYKDKITIDIDQAGTGAKGAKIYLLGRRTL